MQHPDDKCNQGQSRFLNKLSGEERLWHERMFRIGNAAFVYHARTNDVGTKFQLLNILKFL